ncbi:Methionyl-tRNA formyltransferase [Nitrosomonas cryotolerans]|uniref:Methionyl-tRNA formyltransferase n=1 Tax=Nitrosomonas cryotolerans ATCC 49181 TaxID=1131553 RepID=A0A1N6J7D0_9PROT|nr:polysaccharide deacetylase family protein [Nitrosomonas cryotolerans]SFP44993.1 Methionyl-tRNA formyltransferase [Nitrosomonas cryotolerans]SIO40187.1 Methionyl-tRNA formyltransferase [Nitrosomonas cryotolerans ATCC 49181]
MKHTKIVVFTGDLSYSVRKGILVINQSIPNLTWLVVIHAPVKKSWELLGNQWRNLHRNGLRWIPYQLIDICQRIFLKKPPLISTESPGYRYSLEAFKDNRNIILLVVSDIHAQETLDAIHQFIPDLGLSLASPILKKELFSIPRLGTLNLHKGKLPEYRGMPPAFWELWNNEDAIGCTIHWVDEKLDNGAVVKEQVISRQTYSTLKGLQLTLDQVGINLMGTAVRAVLTENIHTSPQSDSGKVYRKPTLAQIACLERKMRTKLAMPGSTLRRWLKNSFFLVQIYWQRMLPRLFKKPKITVLLYHRVTDCTRDNLCVGIEQFDRQMALLRRHCKVLSIQDIINRSCIESSSKPVVCVTFDDGYLDNYENAIPILIKHGIPAAFFVSTGIIYKNGIFPHDLKRKNKKLPVMTWDQLRMMHQEGFTIGSHSVSHIDCASENEDIVFSELTQSLADIRKELGIHDVIFAYPYGGRQHMTQQRLQLVKEIGYTACLSAYGGTNDGMVDRYNILRCGIHYEFSDSAFLYRCHGF